MKNFQMIKMAQKFMKKQDEQNKSVNQDAGNKFAPMQRADTRASTFKGKTTAHNIMNEGMQQNQSMSANKVLDLVRPAGQQHDLCPIHGKPLDVICVTCKERTCSNCALFGVHKGHDVRPEQEVLDQINLRTECLMEMYQMMETGFAEKPNELEVHSLSVNFKTKQEELKKQLKEKFKEMRNILIVQEQTTEAILLKNLQYIDKELKNLQQVDYRKFEEAEQWMKNAKVKLDNFQNN